MQSENVVDLREAISHRAEPAPREIGTDDWRRYEEYMQEIFIALGMEHDAPGTRETPARFLRALYDATAGYDGDAKLLTAFPAEGRGGPDSLISQVVEGPISFHCLCEHHALPFFGTAYIGYVAGEQIVGISKLTRLVRLFARRFTVQERLGEQIADSLVDLIDPHGVAVHLEAAHLCTQMRGVRETEPLTHTTSWRGEYAKSRSLRSEFLSMTGLRA